MTYAAGRLCFVLSAAAFLNAQDFRATLAGRILDAGGAAIPAAKVRATNVSTGEYREAISDAEGNYQFPLLIPSAYVIRAEAQGFKTAVREGLQLSVNQSATLDLKLELGAMSTQVTVTAEAPVLEDANGDRGGLIDEESVKEYPLNTR